MQKFSYHTHTTFSDGHNTIEEMLDQAEKLGWEEIGFSDHLIVHKNIKQSRSYLRWYNSPNNHVYYTDFSKAAADFAVHAENIRRAAQNRKIKVRVGAEVDYFTYQGWDKEFAAFREQTKLDYYISGNHFLQPSEGEILDIKELALLAAPERENVLRNHFAAICQAIESGIFSFIAHIDYIRKSEFCPDEAFWAEKIRVVDCLQKNAVATELSSKGLRKRGDFYPADKLFREIIRRQIPIVVSDDAHRTTELGFEFAKAEDYLQKLGYYNRWAF